MKCAGERLYPDEVLWGGIVNPHSSFQCPIHAMSSQYHSDNLCLMGNLDVTNKHKPLLENIQ